MYVVQEPAFLFRDRVRNIPTYLPTRLPSGLFPLPQPSSSVSVTFLVGPKHPLNVSFLSPSILSQVLPSSLCLAYTTIPPTWQPSTSQTELLPCCSLLHLSLTAYLQIYLFPWTSLIPDFPFALVSSAQTSLYSLQSRCFSVVYPH